MKTETQVTVRLADITCSEHLVPEPDGFVIKAFLACSRTDTRPFRLAAEGARIDQTLRVANIGGRELEFWLCSTHNKIIANATIPLPPEAVQLGPAHSYAVEFKMTSTSFAVVKMQVAVKKREIEKPHFEEPDEELLRREEDPYERQRKEEEELRRARELEEQQAAGKQVKKPAITLTHFNKKDVPFV